VLSGVLAAEAGAEPRSIPTEVEWRVESIFGDDVLDGSSVTLVFHGDGTLSGTASVNRYRSSWGTFGGRIIIFEAVSTMMMGEPGLMGQEKKYLDALHEATRFEAGENYLILSARDGREIILKKD
jgi:heat shock protein HslJ